MTITIGGEAGQGIQTVGNLLARCCHAAGLYTLAVNHFESRIRGGHNFIQVRIADRPVGQKRMENRSHLPSGSPAPARAGLPGQRQGLLRQFLAPSVVALPKGDQA